MRRMVLAALAAAAMAPAGPGEVIVKRQPFLGWDDAIVMTNGTVELTVAPQLGARIFSYKLVDGEELIFTVPEMIRKHLEPGPWPRKLEWHLGGDKTWPFAPKEFPPDPYIAGGQFEAAVAKDGVVTLSGPLSPTYHCRSIRRIAMDPSGSRVVIDNRFRCEGACPKGLATWTVTQVLTPDFVLLDLAHDAPHRNVTRLSGDAPRVFWKGLSPTVLRYDATLGVTREPNKIGVYGRWIAGVRGPVAFLQATELHPKATYDDGANLEIYACDRYYELEALSPNTAPQAGIEIGHRVIWQIVPVDRQQPDAAIARLLAERAAAAHAQPGPQ